MPKSSKLAPKMKWSVSDPRLTMRVLIGILLLANLAMAVVAFKPFGGSADDLRQDQSRLSAELRKAQTTLESTRQHVGKIEIARKEGDDFLTRYIMERRASSAITLEEMQRAATEAGVRILPETWGEDEIEGSETLRMLSITAGFEGNYAGLTKLVNLLEKSQRFLIIDSMNLNAPQQNGPRQVDSSQNLNVTLRLLTFVQEEQGAAE